MFLMVHATAGGGSIPPGNENPCNGAFDRVRRHTGENINRGDKMQMTVLFWGILVIVCLCITLCFLTLMVIALIVSGGKLFDDDVRYPKEWVKADKELAERIKHQYD